MPYIQDVPLPSIENPALDVEMEVVEQCLSTSGNAMHTSLFNPSNPSMDQDMKDADDVQFVKTRPGPIQRMKHCLNLIEKRKHIYAGEPVSSHGFFDSNGFCCLQRFLPSEEDIRRGWLDDRCVCMTLKSIFQDRRDVEILDSLTIEGGFEKRSLQELQSRNLNHGDYVVVPCFSHKSRHWCVIVVQNTIPPQFTVYDTVNLTQRTDISRWVEKELLSIWHKSPQHKEQAVLEPDIKYVSVS